MPTDKAISELDAGSPDSSSLFPYLDPTDTSQAPSGTDKASSAADLAAALGADVASLTAAAIATGDSIGFSDVSAGGAMKRDTVADLLALSTALSWTLVVDENGSSLANWTNIDGTWTSEAGPYFKQATTSAAYHGRYFTTATSPGAIAIMQADVRFPTSGTTDRRAGITAIGNGTLAGNVPWVALGDTGVTWMNRGDQSNNSVAATVAADTWYTLRVIHSGEMMSLYVDGVFKRANRIHSPSGGEEISHFPTLWTYKGEVNYRNVKVWRLNGPA